MFQNQRGFVADTSDPVVAGERQDHAEQVEYWSSRLAGYALLAAAIVVSAVLLLR